MILPFSCTPPKCVCPTFFLFICCHSRYKRVSRPWALLPGIFAKGKAMSQNRRHFMKSTLAAAASITIAGTKSSGRVLGANEAIRVGVAGLHGRGRAHVNAFLGMQGGQITYLIDPDTRTFAAQSRPTHQRPGNRPTPV